MSAKPTGWATLRTSWLTCAWAALEKKDWDPSVEALTHFPSVLEQMNEKLEWTQQIGDAFIAQQADVMDSVQRLRRQAHEAGHLKSTEQQKVVVEGQTIVIESANPQVVYVPAYNPTVVYGAWPYPAYPPYYWPPPPGYTFASGVAWGVGFGVGIAMTAAIFDGFDWNNHDVNVNVNRNTSINRQNVDVKKWQHDPGHRKGVNYRDQASREKYGGADRRAAESRQDFRGHDQRPEARRDGGAGQASQRDGGQGVERGQGGRAGAALETSLLVIAFAAAYAAMRLLGRRWTRTPHWGAIYRNKLRKHAEFDYEI